MSAGYNSTRIVVTPAQTAGIAPVLAPAEPMIGIVHVISQIPAPESLTHLLSAGDSLIPVPLPRRLPLGKACSSLHAAFSFPAR